TSLTPVVPGASYEYTRRATLYGTTWYHEDAFHLFSINTCAPPAAENGLINGTNKYDGSGSYFSTTVEPGYRYKLRIINSEVYAHMKFMIDDHTMEVAAADLVPIEPYNASYIDIGLEQHYDVIVKMNQTADNNWIRAIPLMNGTNMIADWASPSLLMIEEKNLSYPSSFNFVSINGTADDWAYFVIEASNAVDYPMHIHGHDFWVLARRTGTFSGSRAETPRVGTSSCCRPRATSSSPSPSTTLAPVILPPVISSFD
ncbi:hypothetical protein HK405_013068, partial [Cladochytrium tenue]